MIIKYSAVTHVFISCNTPTTFVDSVSVVDNDDDQSCDDDCKDAGQPPQIHTSQNTQRHNSSTVTNGNSKDIFVSLA